MQVALRTALMARLNPVGVVGFVPTAHSNHPNPAGKPSNKRPTAMWNMRTPAHPTSGSKKPHSLN